MELRDVLLVLGGMVVGAAGMFLALFLWALRPLKDAEDKALEDEADGR